MSPLFPLGLMIFNLVMIAVIKSSERRKHDLGNPGHVYKGRSFLGGCAVCAERSKMDPPGLPDAPPARTPPPRAETAPMLPPPPGA